MRIAFYAPFKPLDHPTPSGDQMIGRGIYEALCHQGHTVRVTSRLRCRWIYRNPAKLVAALQERKKVTADLHQHPADCWITYHSYYKSPDILGPFVSRRLKLPYIIFQGSYGTKYKRHALSLPGFLLNRQTLLAADLVVSDRHHDFINLKRLLPTTRLSYVKPGLEVKDFCFSASARHKLKKEWNLPERPVIVTAAMFRQDVKSKGIAWVIGCCKTLRQKGIQFTLIIVGDGPERKRLTQLAEESLPGQVLFTGALPREMMAQVYSVGDVFAFPGFRESLGMVFLEAQSCGLPVIACTDGGVPEVVAHGETGLLSSPTNQEAFISNLQQLLLNKEQRKTMGKAAAIRIRQHHDKKKNLAGITSLIHNVVHKKRNSAKP